MSITPEPPLKTCEGRFKHGSILNGNIGPRWVSSQWKSTAGKPIVLNLWATWCPSCREELPMMAAIAKAHPEVTFVFANQGETSDAVSLFLDQHGISLDHVILDSDLALATLLEAPGLPSTYSVGADGQVVDATIGQISKEALTDTVRSLAGH